MPRKSPAIAGLFISLFFQRRSAVAARLSITLPLFFSILLHSCFTWRLIASVAVPPSDVRLPNIFSETALSNFVGAVAYSCAGYEARQQSLCQNSRPARVPVTYSFCTESVQCISRGRCKNGRQFTASASGLRNKLRSDYVSCAHLHDHRESARWLER